MSQEPEVGISNAPCIRQGLNVGASRYLSGHLGRVLFPVPLFS